MANFSQWANLLANQLNTNQKKRVNSYQTAHEISLHLDSLALTAQTEQGSVEAVVLFMLGSFRG